MARRRTARSAASAEKQEMFGQHTVLKLPQVSTYNNPFFRYTTPSATREHLSAGDKRKIGCYEKVIKKYCFLGDDGKARCSKVRRDAEDRAEGKEIFTKPEKSFTGKRCPEGKGNECSERVQVYDERCKGKSDPCGQDRATCPVQLVWVKGKPNLRFCIRKKQPGYLVPVKNVDDAMRISDAACKKWPYQLGTQEKAEGSEEEGWDPEFFDKNAPDVLVQAREAYPASGGLGQIGRSRGNPIWLAIGLTMGLTAAVLLKRRQQKQATS